MKLGFVSPNTPRDVDPGGLAVELQTRGFESMWVGEHPKIPVASREQFPGAMPDWLPHMWDPFMALLVAARATTTLVVGTAVALPLEHELFTFAKQVATLDVMSGGRLVLGVGVGFRPELELVGPFAWAGRYRALGEMIAALGALWRDDEAHYHGEFFDFEPVWSYPKPVQRPHPPLLAATTGPRATRACLGWADGWIPGDAAIPDVATAVTDVRREAEDAGRDPDALDLTIMAWGDPRVERLARYRELGFHRVILGGGRRDADDPATALPFLDRYAAMVDELA